ncbi:MAG: armadillo-type protein [Olpidium bornovanus]|uniref:Armadillo-type protein n=1 Tax=Olpidium bornovanus TaxID=278681 RepID=A0A8H8A184_9FUNG|nr:MAG: armadillo-type protein [Olpidium bornovanus]
MRQAILDAVLSHSLALMKNKFGNFLMQRCFEYGTRMQTSAMAATMRGNVLSLALDPFGCHVAQKALDNVDEDVKASIVSEMLVRRIPETIIHRFASHVWQRIFEIRWTGAAGAPAVMNYVQNALQGAWHQVAVEENGSLVVQNIFENCSEPEKRPVLREVLDHAPMIARGEFGNWVIQHILEHGAPPDRRRIIQIILDDLPKIATDQYSSKVVEKALKTATRNEVQEIADKLCRTESPSVSSYLNSPTSSELDASASTVGNYYNSGMSGLMMDHPGIATSGPLAYHSDPVAAAAICLPAILALVADQYGNYVVQHLFHVAPSEQRDRVASHIRPYLPALRASKYGQKVAQIVERMSRPGGRSGAHSGGGCGGASGAGGAPGGGGAHHYHQHHHTANNGNPAAVAAAAAAAAAALQHPQQHQLNALFHANVIASYSAGPWGRW